MLFSHLLLLVFKTGLGKPSNQVLLYVEVIFSSNTFYCFVQALVTLQLYNSSFESPDLFSQHFGLCPTIFHSWTYSWFIQVQFCVQIKGRGRWGGKSQQMVVYFHFIFIVTGPSVKTGLFCLLGGCCVLIKCVSP